MNYHAIAAWCHLPRLRKNDFNLNIPRYIDGSEPEDLHDLSAHMNGGIPTADIDALQNYWEVFPALRSSLFAAGDRDGYRRCLVEAGQVKTTILHHPEFTAFAARSLALYTAWCETHATRLHSIAIGDKPKELIHTISEDLLARFVGAELLSKYDIYQLLMDYWAETMQDDVYVLVQDGWEAGNVLRQLVPEKDKNGKNVYREKADLEIAKTKYKADLIPPSLIVARYFADKQQRLDQLQTVQDSLSQELEAFIEEHSGEEGLLEDAKTDAGSVTQKSVNDRLKELKGDSSEMEEHNVVKDCLVLLKKEATAKKAVKEAQTALDETVFAQYPKLTEAEIKALVVEDKWQASLKTAVEAEIERVTQQMANRVKDLEERYAEPLPALLEELETLSSKVETHLQKMGVAW